MSQDQIWRCKKVIRDEKGGREVCSRTKVKNDRGVFVCPPSCTNCTMDAEQKAAHAASTGKPLFQPPQNRIERYTDQYAK